MDIDSKYKISMRHLNISVTMNTYTHLGSDDTKDEMIRLEELEAAKKEVGKFKIKETQEGITVAKWCRGDFFVEKKQML